MKINIVGALVCKANEIGAWEVQITNADYQIDPTQLTNQSLYEYSEINNGDGTFDLIFTGTGPISSNSSPSGGNIQIQWNGVNFGFNPSDTLWIS